MAVEDAELARAMALSLGQADPALSQQSADHAFALSLQQNETAGSDKPSQEEADRLLAMALMQAEESDVEDNEEIAPPRSHKELIAEADRIWAMRLQAAEEQQSAVVSEEEDSDSDIAEGIKKIQEAYNRKVALAVQKREEEKVAPKNCPFAELSIFATANFDTPSKWVHGPRVHTKGSILQAHVVSITSESEVEMYFNHLLATSIGVSKASALPNAWRLNSTGKEEDQLWEGAGKRLISLLEMMNADGVYLLVSLGLIDGNRSGCMNQLVNVSGDLLSKCGYGRKKKKKRVADAAGRRDDNEGAPPEKKMKTWQ